MNEQFERNYFGSNLLRRFMSPRSTRLERFDDHDVTIMHAILYVENFVSPLRCSANSVRRANRERWGVVFPPVVGKFDERSFGESAS